LCLDVGLTGRHGLVGVTKCLAPDLRVDVRIPGRVEASQAAWEKAHPALFWCDIAVNTLRAEDLRALEQGYGAINPARSWSTTGRSRPSSRRSRASARGRCTVS
jgi:hypothetical protein